MQAMRWTAAAVALVLAACGGDDNGATGPGNGGAASFSATVSGDLAGAIKGQARFGLGEHPDYGSVFALEMNEVTNGGGGLLQLVRIGSAVPATGSYTIADALDGTPGAGDFVAVAFDGDETGPTAIFVSTAGSVKVTSSSGSAFKGSFSFEAAGGLFSSPDDTLHITVSGTFNAAPGTQAIQVTSAVIRRSR
jgi:hypothetical protein